MAGLRDAPRLLQISFFIISLAFLVHAIGFATPYWMSFPSFNQNQDEFGIGLWQVCYSIGDKALQNTNNIRTAWYNAVRSFEAIGGILGLCTLIFVMLCIFLSATSDKRFWHILATIICIFTGICIAVGVIIFVSEVRQWETKENPNVWKYLSWSFGLCVTSGGLFLISGGIMICHVIRQRRLFSSVN